MPERRIRALLSLLILVHLSVITLVPNDSSFLKRILLPVLLPYANFFGLNGNWSFFSPDPAPPLYLRYEARKEGETFFQDFFPPEGNPYLFRDFYNRRLALARLFANRTELIDTVFFPYLCRQYKEATSASLSVIMVRLPSLKDVSRGQRINDLSQKEVRQSFVAECTEAGGKP